MILLSPVQILPALCWEPFNGFPTTSKWKPKLLTVTYEAPNDLLTSILLSYLYLLLSSSLIHSSLLLEHIRYCYLNTWSNLRASVLTIPSSWSILFSHIHITSSFTSFRSSLKIHLSEIIPAIVAKISTSSLFFCLLLSTFSSLGFFYPLVLFSLTDYMFYLLTWFLGYYCYLHQKCKLNKGREFYLLYSLL